MVEFLFFKTIFGLLYWCVRISFKLVQNNNLINDVFLKMYWSLIKTFKQKTFKEFCIKANVWPGAIPFNQKYQYSHKQLIKKKHKNQQNEYVNDLAASKRCKMIYYRKKVIESFRRVVCLNKMFSSLPALNIQTNFSSTRRKAKGISLL